MLGSFLSDDLAEAHLGLTSGARSHLDKFRSFLQSYYVAKLGYFPPSDGAFPKNIYGQMCSEFQKLYDLMVDAQFSSVDNIPTSQNGGICVIQCTQAFDARHKFPSLEHPLPLLPEIEESASLKSPRLSKRFSFSAKTDKMKPDPRLVSFRNYTTARLCVPTADSKRNASSTRRKQTNTKSSLKSMLARFAGSLYTLSYRLFCR
jgi:hypothetical protein